MAPQASSSPPKADELGAGGSEAGGQGANQSAQSADGKHQGQPAAHPAKVDPTAYPYWRRNMRTLFVANTLLASGFAAASPYLPLILREIGFKGELETAVGYTVGLFFMVSFVLTPVWGAVADHFGRKAMVLRAGLGMGLLYTLMPFTDTPWLFMLVYAFMGAFNGFVPAALALAATNTPTRFMGKALSTVQTGALLGNTFGPVLGTILALTLPRYRDLFFVTGGFILSAGLVALLFTRERKVVPEGPFRLTIIQDFKHLVRIPKLPVVFGLNFLFSFSFFGSIPVSSVFMLNLLLGAGVEESREFWMGAVVMAMAISSTVGLPIWGRVLDRFEPSRVLALALAAGMLGSVPTWLAQDAAHLTAARFIFGMTAAGIMPAVVTMLRRLAPRGMEARAMALGTAFGMLGMGSGPLLGGLMGPAFGLRVYFAVNTVLIALGFAVWVRRGLRV